MTTGLPWRRIFAEGVAIVVSILLAFGIQAWWEASQDRADERRALEALRSELQENLTILRSSIEQHATYARSAERLMNISLGLAEVPAQDELVPLLANSLISYRTTNYVSGTITALLTSGDIDLIRDYEIQRRVAALPAYFAEAAEDEALHVDVRTQLLLPFMITRAPAMWTDPPRRSESLPEGLRRRIGDQALELIGDAELEALLGNSIQMNGLARASLESAAIQVEELIELISIQLDGAGR